MTKWLKRDAPKIRVHSKTARFLQTELGKLGYTDVAFSANLKS